MTRFLSAIGNIVLGKSTILSVPGPQFAPVTKRHNNKTKKRKQQHDFWTATMEATRGLTNNSRRHRLQEACGPFHVVGCVLMGRNADLAAAAISRRFRANFGVGPVVCNVAWKMLRDNGQTNGAEPKHLLYALKWLKIYGTESVLAGDLRIDEKTLRKWVWRFVYCLSNFESDVVRPSLLSLLLILVTKCLHC
jgi:hypothetical protein